MTNLLFHLFIKSYDISHSLSYSNRYSHSYMIVFQTILCVILIMDMFSNVLVNDIVSSLDNYAHTELHSYSFLLLRHVPHCNYYHYHLSVDYHMEL